MFEFQGHRNNPVKLLEILERFTRWWFYAPHEEETGVSVERLALVDIPDPLKTLYGFAGEWPGGSLESIFSNQDSLVPFECLEIQDGKLVFAWENQGVWSVATEATGEDPPVYLSVDDDPYKFFCDSLSQFLVTFCLHECIFGAASLSYVDNLRDVNQTQGKIPIPLWLDVPYPSANHHALPTSFYLVDGKVLQMHNWCAASFPNADEQYPDYFPNNSSHRPQGEPKKLWEIPSVPKFMKVQHLEMLIRRHECNAQSHLDKASEYRSFLKQLERDSQS